MAAYRKHFAENLLEKFKIIHCHLDVVNKNKHTFVASNVL